MDLSSSATLTFNTHIVNVTVNDEGRICCFKYTRTGRCDFDVFYEQYEAAEYIVEPFRTQYHLVIYGESEH